MARRSLGTAIAAVTAMVGAGLVVVAGPAAAGASGAAAAIAVNSGDYQAAQDGTGYAHPLAVLVTDASGNPVSGSTVHFSAPVIGPSVAFNSAGCPADPPGTASTDCYVNTGANGVATTGAFTANSTEGTVHVYASTSTSSGYRAASFTLTNTSSPPRSVTPGSVRVSNSAAGATGVTYTVGFTVNTQLSTDGGSIYLTFPNGTALSTNCTPNIDCPFSVSYGPGTNAMITAAAPSKVIGPGATSTSPTPNHVVIDLGGLANELGTGYISPGTPVTVTIGDVINPTSASSSYVAEESTSSDPVVVASAPYAVNGGAPASLAATSGSGQATPAGTRFAAPLVATARDGYGNPAPGAAVTFTIGTSAGASATFANGTATETDNTDASGRATTSSITANGFPGTYSVTARLGSGGPSASFSLTNTAYTPPAPGVASQAVVRSGSDQSALVATTYGSALSVTILDGYGNPVVGVPVTFTAPASGPSGHFATGAAAETDTTDASGAATASPFTANTVAGSFVVTASTANGAQTGFNLTNTPGAATAVQMLSGQNQTAAIDTAFARPFVAQAVDQYGNPIPYTNLYFAGPTTGPGGTFANGLTYEAQTANSTGQATSSVFTANAVVGTYQMAAAVSTSDYTLYTETNSFGGSVRAGGGGSGGYWLAGPDGAVQAFGDAGFYGSAFGAPLNKPVVGMTAAAGGNGYWLVASDGGVFNYGAGAAFHGSAGNIKLARPIVGMAADPATGGYWLVASDGGVFSYDAPFFGSAASFHLNKPIVGMAAAPDGSGYWLVASDGGIFAFGSGARFYGSTGNIALNKPVVGMAAAPGGNGYWLVASDGGIFAYGPGAGFYGSTGNIALNSPVVGMAAPAGGNGYWLLGQDGGVFSFGPGAPFRGSASSSGARLVAMAGD